MEAQELETSTSTSTGSSAGWLIILIVVFAIAYALKPASHQAAPQTQQTQHVQLQPQSPAGGHPIYGKPTLTASQIDVILAAYHSPAAGQGQTLYDLGVQYGIDPAYALAFFMHESTLGTQGEARATHSLGNLRCINGAECIDQDRGGYAAFASWHDGFHAWFVLITSDLYKGDGRTTVETIIPRYAPTADSNNETAYISALVYCVQSWQGGKVVL